MPILFVLSPGYYAVTFDEAGLAHGTRWTVEWTEAWRTTGQASFGGSNVFVATNGTYTYAVGTLPGYTDWPSARSVTVDGTGPAPIAIRFNATALYRVTFQESGLPENTGWAVSIGSQLGSSRTSNVTLEETNGTYGYVVLPVSGFVTASSGLLLVNWTNVTVPLTFTPQTYPVIVVEFGLPNGTSWTVDVVNQSLGINDSHSTSASALIFDLPNGTYDIYVRAAGYTASPSAGTFTVAGSLSGFGPTVDFTAQSKGSSGSPSAGSAWYLPTILIGLLVVIALLAALLFRRRQPPRPERSGASMPVDPTAPGARGPP